MTSSCFQHYIIQFYFEADQEIERYTGVPIQIVDESGRVIFKDRRNVAFDRNGEMAVGARLAPVVCTTPASATFATTCLNSRPVARDAAV